MPWRELPKEIQCVSRLPLGHAETGHLPYGDFAATGNRSRMVQMPGPHAWLVVQSPNWLKSADVKMTEVVHQQENILSTVMRQKEEVGPHRSASWAYFAL